MVPPEHGAEDVLLTGTPQEPMALGGNDTEQ
jgi:hypothetical protein